MHVRAQRVRLNLDVGSGTFVGEAWPLKYEEFSFTKEPGMLCDTAWAQPWSKIDVRAKLMANPGEPPEYMVSIRPFGVDFIARLQPDLSSGSSYFSMRPGKGWGSDQAKGGGCSGRKKDMAMVYWNGFIDTEGLVPFTMKLHETVIREGQPWSLGNTAYSGSTTVFLSIPGGEPPPGAHP